MLHYFVFGEDQWPLSDHETQRLTAFKAQILFTIGFITSSFIPQSLREQVQKLQMLSQAQLHLHPCSPLSTVGKACAMPRTRRRCQEKGLPALRPDAFPTFEGPQSISTAQGQERAPPVPQLETVSHVSKLPQPLRTSHLQRTCSFCSGSRKVSIKKVMRPARHWTWVLHACSAEPAFLLSSAFLYTPTVDFSSIFLHTGTDRVRLLQRPRQVGTWWLSTKAVITKGDSKLKMVSY